MHTDAESKFRRHSILSRPWGYILFLRMWLGWTHAKLHAASQNGIDLESRTGPAKMSSLFLHAKQKQYTKGAAEQISGAHLRTVNQAASSRTAIEHLTWTHVDTLANENQTISYIQMSIEPSVCSSMFRTWWWLIFQRWDLQCWIARVSRFLNLTALGVMLLFLEITYFSMKRRFFGTKLQTC